MHASDASVCLERGVLVSRLCAEQETLECRAVDLCADLNTTPAISLQLRPATIHATQI